MKPKDILTKTFLNEHFIKRRKSVGLIASELGLNSKNSVSQAIERYGLTRGALHDSSHIFTQQFLEENYVKQNLSLKDVAVLGGFQRKSIVRKALIKHGIQVREHTRSHKMIMASQNKRSHHTISGRYFHSLISGSVRRNIHFDITLEQIWDLLVSQKHKCKLSALPIRFHQPGEKATAQTASLDRIDSDKGYTLDNIQWLHKDVNKMKWEHSQDRFKQLCKLIARNKD